MKSETDQLVSRVSSGDDSAFEKLCAEYDSLIKSMSRRYARMAGVSDEAQLYQDFSQEASLALYRAAQTYRCGNGEITFGLYAKICIRNALVSELRRINKKKKAELRRNGAELESENRADGQIGHVLSATDAPDTATLSELLSSYEKKVFELYVGGVKVRDIAELVGREPKSVSNAVYRIKEKLRASMDMDNE